MRVWILAAVAVAAFNVAAHDSPEHAVEALSLRMARSGPSAHLLFQRASEYRALGKLREAAADLEEAVRLDPKAAHAYSELSRVRLSLGQPEAALMAVNKAIALLSAASDCAPLCMLRAQIRLARRDYTAGLADCKRAFSNGPGELDWFLIRGQLQARLGRFEECAAAYKQGLEQTGSAVLMVEWVEALIDAGRYQQALDEIEPELEAARWRSAWLLRRARARLGLGDIRSAAQDSQDAVAELAQRIDPNHPDLTLLADRALAWHLLGNEAAARKGLALLKRSNAEDWLLWRLEWLLNSKPGGSVVAKHASGR